MRNGRLVLLALLILGFFLMFLFWWGLSVADQSTQLQHSDPVILRKLLKEKTTLMLLGKDINQDKKTESIGVVIFNHNQLPIPGYVPCSKFALIHSGDTIPLLEVKEGIIFQQSKRMGEITIPFLWKNSDIDKEWITFYAMNPQGEPVLPKFTLHWNGHSYEYLP